MDADGFDPGEHIQDWDAWRDRLRDLEANAQEVASADRVEAEDFGASVEEKAASMLEYLEEHGYLTDAQQEAIGNMEAGVDRWLERLS